MDAYDPSFAPAPRDWLALSELERIALVEAFHEQKGDFGQNLKLHASIHAVVENQLALQQPAEVGEAILRLLRQGLNRHDAIHAIGSVFAEHLFPLLKATSSPPAFDEPQTARRCAWSVLLPGEAPAIPEGGVDVDHEFNEAQGAVRVSGSENLPRTKCSLTPYSPVIAELS